MGGQPAVGHATCTQQGSLISCGAGAPYTCPQEPLHVHATLSLQVTGEQVERAAEGGGGGGGGGAGPAGGAPQPEEEVRGPHASLAVRLSQRDPGRSFVLGG